MFQPQIGDLLVTDDRLVGFMVRYERKKAIVSGEYYFRSYPVGNEFDRAEVTEGITHKNLLIFRIILFYFYYSQYNEIT